MTFFYALDWDACRRVAGWNKFTFGNPGFSLLIRLTSSPKPLLGHFCRIPRQVRRQIAGIQRPHVVLGVLGAVAAPFAWQNFEQTIPQQGNAREPLEPFEPVWGD